MGKCVTSLSVKVSKRSPSCAHGHRKFAFCPCSFHLLPTKMPIDPKHTSCYDTPNWCFACCLYRPGLPRSRTNFRIDCRRHFTPAPQDDDTSCSKYIFASKLVMSFHHTPCTLRIVFSRVSFERCIRSRIPNLL